MSATVNTESTAGAAPPPDVRSARRRRGARSDARLAFWFILPALIGFLACYVWPTIRGVYFTVAG